MSKHYVVVVLEVVDVQDDITLCQTGCKVESSKEIVAAPIANGLIVKTIVLTPDTLITVDAIIKHLRATIK